MFNPYGTTDPSVEERTGGFFPSETNLFMNTVGSDLIISNILEQVAAREPPSGMNYFGILKERFGAYKASHAADPELMDGARIHEDQICRFLLVKVMTDEYGIEVDEDEDFAIPVPELLEAVYGLLVLGRRECIVNAMFSQIQSNFKDIANGSKNRIKRTDLDAFVTRRKMDGLNATIIICDMDGIVADLAKDPIPDPDGAVLEMLGGDYESWSLAVVRREWDHHAGTDFLRALFRTVATPGDERDEVVTILKEKFYDMHGDGK